MVKRKGKVFNGTSAASQAFTLLVIMASSMSQDTIEQFPEYRKAQNYSIGRWLVERGRDECCALIYFGARFFESSEGSGVITAERGERM